MPNYNVTNVTGSNPLNVEVGEHLGEAGSIGTARVTVQFPAGLVLFDESPTNPGTYEGSFGGHPLRATFSEANLNIDVLPTSRPRPGQVGQVGTIVAVDQGTKRPLPKR
jgi:hypothetical protein